MGDGRSRKRQSGSALIVAGLGLSTGIFVGISGVLYASKAKQAGELEEAQAQIQQMSQLRKDTVSKDSENSAVIEKLKQEKADVEAALSASQAELTKVKAELSLLQLEKTSMETANARFQVEIAKLKLQLKTAAPAGGGSGVQPLTRKQLTAQQLCIRNLQQIQGAKKQWAIYQKKTQEDVAPSTDLFGVVKFIKREPYCPEGGTYTIGKVSEHPTCTHAGHVY